LAKTEALGECVSGPAHAFGYEGVCVSGGIILAHLNAQFKAHLTVERKGKANLAQNFQVN